MYIHEGVGKAGRWCVEVVERTHFEEAKVASLIWEQGGRTFRPRVPRGISNKTSGVGRPVRIGTLFLKKLRTGLPLE